MAYGRQSIRKAGEFLYGLEEDYANAIQRLIIGDEYHNIPRAIAGGLAGTPIGSAYKTIKADTNMERALAMAMVGANDAANLGIRYGIPLGIGSTVGNGIVGLTQPEEPVTGQLPFN